MAASSSLYTALITALLTSIAIKYQGRSANPFQERSPSTLVFVVALCCHAIALTARENRRAVIFLLNASGVIACQTLLWILVPELLWYGIINIVFLLLAVFFYYKDICELLSTCFQWILEVEIFSLVGQDGFNVHQIPDSEELGGTDIEAQTTSDLEPVNTM